MLPQVQGNVKSLNDDIEEAHYKINNAHNIIERDKGRHNATGCNVFDKN